MTAEKPKDVLQPVDAYVRRQAKALVRSARYAALGTLDPEPGAPSVSRVALATFPSGEPGFFISALAAHQRNLVADKRCSLLVGGVGKGDPLAYARMTLIGTAVRLIDGPEMDNFRFRYRSKNSKSKLYQDLPDFSYWKFLASRLSLNAGFGKAYAPEPSDLATSMPDADEWYAIEKGVIEHMNEDHSAAVDKYAAKAGGSGTGWHLACIDPEGLDIIRGDEAVRMWFDPPLLSTREIRQRLVSLAQS